MQRAEAELERGEARLARAAATGKELAEQLAILERDLKAARADLRGAEARQSLATHRSRLRPGEPCPLCGATEHPLAAGGGAEAGGEQRSRVRALEADLAGRLTDAGRNLQEQRAVQERIGELQRDRSAARDALADAQRSWAAAVAGSDEWAADADASVNRSLAAAAEAHAAEVRAVEVAEQEVRALSAAASAAENEHLQAVDDAQSAGERLRAAERALRVQEQALHELVAELRVAVAARDELAAALDPAIAFAGWQLRATADPASFGARCEELAVRGAVLREAEAALAKARAAVERAALEERGRAQRRDRAAGDWDQATAGLDLEPDELQRALGKDDAWIRAEADALGELAAAVQRARAVLLERRERRLEHEGSGRPDLGPAEAKQRLADVRRRQEEARKAAAELRVWIERDDWTRRLLAELRPRLDAQQEVVRLWSTMDALIGSARGDKFQIFAQSLTMDLLVEQANVRLQELARRYRLRRVPGEDMDLVVVDLDMGEAVRSIHTLSGGESFLVSLALALALASLSAQRTRVETLFIDEGFGSLDTQSLETALAALDALQATGCQVGVISHVEGLAERIGARVEVTADGRGASLLRVR
jgi:exonuclease SbcC